MANTIIWIHSINETEKLTTLETLSRGKTSKFIIPVRVLTRKSQKEQYESILTQYADFFEELELVTEEDSKISNLGKTKSYEITSSHDEGITNIFMLDDDITRLDLRDEIQPEKALNEWLRLHEEISEKDENCIMTSVVKDLSKAKFKKEADLYGGICTQCTLLNTKRAVESGLLYRDNDVIGHEDVDYRAQLIANGKTYYRFFDVIYGTEPLNTDTFAGDTLQERFTRQRDLFKKTWGEQYPWILYTTSVINGVELDDIKLDPFINKSGTLVETH